MVWRRYLTLALRLLLLEPLGYGKVHLLNERVHLVEGPEGSGNKTPVSGSVGGGVVLGVLELTNDPSSCQDPNGVCN